MAFTLRVSIIVKVSDNASNSFNSPNETTAQVNNSARLEAWPLQDRNMKHYLFLNLWLLFIDAGLLICSPLCQVVSFHQENYKASCSTLVKLHGACAGAPGTFWSS